MTFADLSCTSSWMPEFSGLRNSFPDILLILLSKYPHLFQTLKKMMISQGLLLNISKMELGFPGGSVIKNLPAKAGGVGLIPE